MKKLKLKSVGLRNDQEVEQFTVLVNSQSSMDLWKLPLDQPVLGHRHAKVHAGILDTIWSDEY